MSGLNRITPKAASYARDVVGAPIRWISRQPWQKTVCDKFQDQKANIAFISGLGVFSIILKDGFGCYLYVKQSLANKKIPEDKRKFVAALDLANGGLMILLQILMTYTISKKTFQEKMFNKWFGKFFERPASKSMQAILESKEKIGKGVRGNQNFHRALEGYKDASISAFGALSALVAATIVGKRILTPFIATPLADKTKAWMCRNDKPVQIHKDTQNTYDQHTPAAEKQQDKKAGNMLSKLKVSA